MSIHIGEKIKQRAKSLRIGPTEFGKLINTSKQNVYGIFKRKSIDTDLLKRISEVLEYDFFQYYFKIKEEAINNLQEDKTEYKKRTPSNDTTAIEKLSKELESCKKEITYLKKINELLEKQSKG